MRCLKRRLSDVVFRQLGRDAARRVAGPGGHSGAALMSSAASETPHADSLRTSHFPDPSAATVQLREHHG
jgi:hypothetical protein